MRVLQAGGSGRGCSVSSAHHLLAGGPEQDGVLKLSRARCHREGLGSRWSGRNHREKIGIHFSFDQLLNMEPCCSKSLHPKAFPAPLPAALAPQARHVQSTSSELSAVVMHHGKGFGSGHYTAYCYNTEGGLWVHCNDSKLTERSVDEVC